jgi:tetratricopeptide (TPR) repeat protein
MRMNQSGAALEALLKSVEYGGGHDETVHVAIGQALRMKGDYRAAIEWLEAHAPLDRNAATVRNNLAWYLLTADPPELRDPARACRYAAEAVEIEPAAADLLDTYLAALHAAGRGAEAAAVLERRLPRIEGTAAREALLRKWDRPAD